MKPYFVYLLLCADNTFYTGITTDLVRRLAEHNGTGKGAKYTRSRQPCLLVYSEQLENRSLALKREHELRKTSHLEKRALIP
jgi:putative endonuclease